MKIYRGAERSEGEREETVNLRRPKGKKGALVLAAAPLLQSAGGDSGAARSLQPLGGAGPASSGRPGTQEVSGATAPLQPSLGDTSPPPPPPRPADRHECSSRKGEPAQSRCTHNGRARHAAPSTTQAPHGATCTHIWATRVGDRQAPRSSAPGSGSVPKASSLLYSATPATPGGKTPSWGRRAAADPPGTKDRKGASACTRLGAPLRCFGKCALCGVSEDRLSGDTSQIELGSAWTCGCCTADYPALFRSSGMLQRSDSHAPNTRRCHLLLSCSVGMPHALPGLLRSDR